MRHRLKWGLLLAALLTACAGLGATPAAGSGLSPPLADCNTHARLTHHYTVKQLEHALATMQADISEYSDCHDVIQRQLLVQLGELRQPGGPGGGGGSFLPVWLIVLLAVLVAGAAGFGALAVRSRRQGSDGPALD